MPSPNTVSQPHRRARRIARLAGLLALAALSASAPASASASSLSGGDLCASDICVVVEVRNGGFMIAICNGNGGNGIGIDTDDGLLVYYPNPHGGYRFTGWSSNCP